jgi:outer membrane protein OmpA-like peptidoglycan-associated protein
MIEYKLYITNPNYFNSTQNDFEKNLSGKITVTETVSPESGMTERTAVGEVSGIPVPFTNPQTNVVVEDNNGKIVKTGEPSMFSPPKVLATEMIAIIILEFSNKFGVNIDFSLDPPEEKKEEKSLDSTQSTTTEPAKTEEKSAFDFGNALKVAGVAAAVVGGAAAIGAGAYALIKNAKDKKAADEVAKNAPLVGTPSISGTPSIAGSPIVVGTPSIVGSPSVADTATKPVVVPVEDNKLKGIKILVPSQYLDVYEISMYGGAPALMTTKDSKQMVWLDKDYDRPEFLPSNLTSPQKLNDDGTGDFKINIHLGYPGGKKVGNWSEDGSQVFSTADELNDFFALCEKHKEKYGNKITYTLSTKEDWDEAQKSVQTNKAAQAEPVSKSPSNTDVAVKETPPKEEVTVKQVEEVIDFLVRNLTFDEDKYDIKEMHNEKLNKLAEVLIKQKDWTLKIEGHTDDEGGDESNLKLSKNRAAEVKKYLVSKGVMDNQIITEGYGETLPIEDNSTEPGKAKNRRIEFTVTKPDKTEITTISKKKIHRVKDGENLSKIAKKYNMKVADIKKFNNLKDDELRLNQVLKLEGSDKIVDDEITKAKAELKELADSKKEYGYGYGESPDMSFAKSIASLQAGSNNLDKNNSADGPGGVKYQTTSSSMVKERVFKLPNGRYGYIIVIEYTKKE